jgi:lysophospholipid acyltransferase (LPLAT)-like uncharacterized protein
VKGLIRSPAVQAALAWLIAGYVEWVTTTLRWRWENVEAAEAALASPEGAIALFWHGRIAQAMTCRPFLGARPRRVLISLSRDGAFIAKAAERLGVPTIRGSTGREGEALAKGGAGAFRAAVGSIGQGAVMLVTPDGPRGPAETIPEGPVQLARAARCAVFGLGLAARPAIALKSWDAARIPLPFARAALVIAGPLRAPVRLPPEGLGPLQAQWEAAMRAATARAEALLAQADGAAYRRARALGRGRIRPAPAGPA